MKKRLKVTASGKIVRSRAYGSHLSTKKSAKRKRRLRTATFVAKANISAVKRLI
jgi:large subunit ribosomal protein L35